MHLEPILAPSSLRNFFSVVIAYSSVHTFITSFRVIIRSVVLVCIFVSRCVKVVSASVKRFCKFSRSVVIAANSSVLCSYNARTSSRSVVLFCKSVVLLVILALVLFRATGIRPIFTSVSSQRLLSVFTVFVMSSRILLDRLISLVSSTILSSIVLRSAIEASNSGLKVVARAIALSLSVLKF